MKKIFKSKRIQNVLFFILGGVVIGGIGITATTYILQANEIEYKNNKSVQEAIEELYTMAQNSSGSNQTLPIGTLDIAGQTIYIPYTGTYKSVYCVYGTTESYGSVGTINNGKCNLSGLTVNTKYYYKIIGYDNAENLYETKGEATTVSRKPTVTLTDLPKGVKAIVYLDPTDLSRYCDANNSPVGGTATSGCMKWYAFKEDNTSYTMILDHDTGSSIWAPSRLNTSGPTTLNAKLNILKRNNGWEVTPRAITYDEVVAITGSTNWGTSYPWMDTTTYWTSTPDSGNSARAWSVDYSGELTNTNGNATVNMEYGLRPVITVQKSNF